MFAAVSQFFTAIRTLLEAFTNGATAINNLSKIGVHMSEDYLNEADIKRQANLAAMLKDNGVAAITAPAVAIKP